MKEKPNYYAILDADVRYDETISMTAKVIYAEITALTQKEGYAWASNKYFSDNFGISPSQVSRVIKELKESGYISIEIKDHYMRKITLRINRKPLRKNAGGVTQKPQRGVTQKPQDNNTSLNNINNKGFEEKRPKDNRGLKSKNKEKIRQAMKTKNYSKLKSMV